MRFLTFLGLMSVLATAFAQAPPPGRGGPPPGDDESFRLLKRVIDAQNKLKYGGQRTVEMFVNGEMVRFSEVVWREGDVSRIEYPENSPRAGFIILEKAGERQEFDPRRNEIRFSKGGREAANDILRKMLDKAKDRQIRLARIEGLNIAGRKTFGLEIGDRAGNPTQRFYIDWDTGLLLKAVQLGRGREVRGGFEFTRVTFQPTFPDGWKELKRAGARIVHEGPPEGVPWRVVEPGWTPPGFRETGRGVREIDGRQFLLIHFADGKSHLTIFQSPGGPVRLPNKPGEGEPTIRTLIVGNLWVAAIGSLDPATLDRILKSMN